MQVDERYARLGHDNPPFRSRASRFLFRAAVLAGGALVLIAALAISIVLFAIAFVAIAGFGAYFWWKTRDLRREIRSALQGGNVIEGEVIPVDSRPESKQTQTRAGRN